MIRKLNKIIIKRLRHPGSSSNFLNKFLYHFERSDLEANGIKSLQNSNTYRVSDALGYARNNSECFFLGPNFSPNRLQNYGEKTD